MNQNAFGAAYYASALIHLIRGGADLEMRWTATSKKLDWGDRDDAYGLMSMNGEPTPACLAKQLFAQHVRYGDWVRFPASPPANGADVDAIVAWDGNGRRSGVFVNTTARPRVLTVADWDEKLGGLQGGPAARREHAATAWPGSRFDGTVRLEGYGMAVVTNAATTRRSTDDRNQPDDVRCWASAR